MTPCNCDTATGECQGPLGCKAVSALVKALEEIARQYENPDIGHRDFRVNTALIVDAALSSYRGEGK